MKPELTAIYRKTLPMPVMAALKAGYIKGNILDYGCGHGAVKKLLGQKYKVTNYDPHYFPDWPKGEFDTVLCLYVLNVVSMDTRRNVMRGVRYFLKPGGTAVIAIRTPEDISAAKKPTWKKYQDGWITPKNTFQHGVTPSEMKYLGLPLHLVKQLNPNTYIFR